MLLVYNREKLDFKVFSKMIFILLKEKQVSFELIYDFLLSLNIKNIKLDSIYYWQKVNSVPFRVEYFLLKELIKSTKNFIYNKKNLQEHLIECNLILKELKYKPL